MAQQRSGGIFHFYMHADALARRRGEFLAMSTDFDGHLLERKAPLLLAGL